MLWLLQSCGVTLMGGIASRDPSRERTAVRPYEDRESYGADLFTAGTTRLLNMPFSRVHTMGLSCKDLRQVI